MPFILARVPLVVTTNHQLAWGGLRCGLIHTAENNHWSFTVAIASESTIQKWFQHLASV